VLSYRAQAEWIQTSHIQKLCEQTGLTYPQLKKKAAENTPWFWETALADMGISFETPYSTLLKDGLPFPKWALDGQISIVHHCIDRHLNKRGKSTALIFESDTPGPAYQWSYNDLARESQYICNQLKESGAKPGDRAALLMPMSLEMVAAFFGILRAGLTVVPIFSGYGEEAIRARIDDAEIRFIFVQEVTTRRGKEIPVRQLAKNLAKTCSSVKKCFVLNRQEFLKGHPETPELDKGVRPAESECLLLYTSGTTGKPKACVHTPFGVLATTGKEHRYSFDVRADDSFFWYTDIGWMMGPWELLGALQYGASVVLYEGVPDYPDSNRLWRMIDEHRVTQLGISPTAVRVLKKNLNEDFAQISFRSLRLLGSTGEPWDEETWLWFFEKIGRSQCPIINISGGTEIMGCLLSPTPLDDLKPATLAGPALGVNAQIWTEAGERLEKGLGHLVCLSPLPSMTKGFLHSKERYVQTYFEKFGEKVWYHGDWALCDDEGFWFLRGRSDDTIKVAGKRVGPNEYESALMEHPQVAEVAAVGLPHPIKGEGVHCFVVLKDPSRPPENFEREAAELISKKMGKALMAERILSVPSLPKTRSGKILRSLIRKVILHEDPELSAVENPDSIQTLKELA